MVWLAVVCGLVVAVLVKYFDSFEYAVVLGFMFTFIWLSNIYECVKQDE